MIPHQGAMCLLDQAESWSAGDIVCRARLDGLSANPLRRAGRLSTLCGCEYAFQAAALHGALLAGGISQQPGYLAGLRVSLIAVPYLDDPGLGAFLRVRAVLEAADPAGMIYGFSIAGEGGGPVLEGRFTIRIPGVAA
jgi:predicted hotdog family 3-hydroxylacyl-ACP dehydratase